MALALLHERRYELSGDAAQLDAAVATLKRLHELAQSDPRAKQILDRLLETRQARQGDAGEPQ